MVEPTNRNCEFVAHLSPERARLGKAQVMRVGRCPAANNAGMGRHEPAVLLVAQADGLCGNAATAGTEGVGDTWNLLVGLRPLRRYSVVGPGRGGRRLIWILDVRRELLRGHLITHRTDLRSEACLDQLSVRSREGVLGGQAALCPTGGLVGGFKNIKFSEEALAQRCRLIGDKD